MKIAEHPEGEEIKLLYTQLSDLCRGMNILSRQARTLKELKCNPATGSTPSTPIPARSRWASLGAAWSGDALA
jgi:hypothetical protein